MKRDITIAIEEYKKYFEQRAYRTGFRTEDEREMYEAGLHEGFIKGFMVALDKVSELMARGKAQQ